ncbi:MAG TPA: PKD domain-containing protein [Chitinophagaceae bacterium]|nr:PKD domain-containing protein [Chitinophagaceae bacterium]
MALCNSSLAQKALDVNLLTGSAQVSIPIGVLTSGDIVYPISFNYWGGGVKVDDYGQRFGLGWSFSAEAAVRREVRGFPDDVEVATGTGNPVYKGWIRTGNAATAVDNFTIVNDNNPNTCTDEVTDYSYMNSNFPDNLDTEPDIFTVDVPGLNFQFVFDKNQQIKTIPYRDVKIDYTLSQYAGEEGQISSFTITNDKGIKYVFSQNYFLTFRYITENIDLSSLPAFIRTYKFYHNTNGLVYYRSAWYITSITDTKLNQLTYSYEMTEGDPPSFGNENIRLVIPQNQIQNLYIDRTHTSIPRIKKINVFQGGIGGVEDGLDFAYKGNNPHASLHEMKFLRSGVIVWLNVAGPFNKTNDGEKAGRYFLDDIFVTAEHCSAITQKYRFTYYNVDLVNKTSYCTGVDSITNAQDYWGCYNGAINNPDLIPPIWVYAYNSSVSKYKITPIPNYQGNDQVYLSGSDRSVNANAVAGSLKRIIYPNGGVTEIEYDNNEYFDADVNGAIAGGGIRVRKITNNDGLNTNEVTYYDYNDPSNNVTTGKAISIPDFTFAFPNSTSYSTIEDRVKNSTYRTLYDYSGERKQIIYGKVTVRKTNGGKTLYEFNTSGTRGSAPTGDWAESFVNITRQITSLPNPCTAIAPDFFTNGKNIYPFPSNANFDFARGLLDKVYNYNESGGLISEQAYTYNYSHSSATKIAALKFDDVGNVRGYSKYNILTNQDKLIVSQITKTYNASNPNSSVYTSETQLFEYPTGSIAYRLPITIKKENSDGKTYVTSMKYAKDYTTTGNGDDAEKAIHRLKEIGYNALIESYQSVQQSGQSEKFISGSLTKFKKSAFGEFAVNVPLPNETYSFAEPNGTTSFTPSAINSTTQVFTFDSKYFKTGTVLKLNEDGNPGSVIGNSRITSSVLYHFPLGLKVVEFSNAKQDEILYAPFDYYSIPGIMVYPGGSTVKPGRYSTSCLAFTTGVNISGTIEKAATNKNIVFSCWIKDAPGSGSLTVTLTASGFSANYSVPFTAHSNWKYYEIKMPRPSPQTITVTVTTTDALKIDDILVYPDNASVKTNSYTKLTSIRKGVEVSNGVHLTAETGMNGTTRYYQYANTAMPHLIKDVDENIVQINEPRQINQTAEFAILFMTLPPIVQVSIPADFDVFVFVPCDAVITYTWDFGDGSSPTVTTTKTATHTYTTAGSYVPSCTISAAGYTSFTYSDPLHPVVVHGGPIPQLCASGVIEYSQSTGCELAICTGGHQPTCIETKFIVSSMSGGSITEITNWHWQKAPAGTSNWTTVSNGAVGVIIVPFSTTPPVTQSYKVKCTVTLGNGLTGTSAEYTIISN